ncbi:hypothetical protein FPQ18DRAFT_393308 [Pyronema domesticum]|nr:hypothetical protein FPQ18DRAFT_393308 [Pyronema domesticum]
MQHLQSDLWLAQLISLENYSRPAFVVFDTVGSVEAIAEAHALTEAWGLRKLEANYHLPSTLGGTPENSNTFGALLQSRFTGGMIAVRGLVNRSVDVDPIHACVHGDLTISEADRGMKVFVEGFIRGQRRMHLLAEPEDVAPGWIHVGRTLIAGTPSVGTVQLSLAVPVTRRRARSVTSTLDQDRPTIRRTVSYESGMRNAQPIPRPQIPVIEIEEVSVPPSPQTPDQRSEAKMMISDSSLALVDIGDEEVEMMQQAPEATTAEIDDLMQYQDVTAPRPNQLFRLEETDLEL